MNETKQKKQIKLNLKIHKFSNYEHQAASNVHQIIMMHISILIHSSIY